MPDKAKSKATYKPLQIVTGVSLDTSISTSWAPEDVCIKLTVDEAIDRLGNGGFHRRLLWAAGICNGVNAMAVMALSFIRASVRLEYNLSIDQSAWLTSSVFLGILVGTFLFGPLGDIIGRKPTFLISSALTAVCGIASVFLPNYAVLVILRAGVGMGVGGTVIPFDTVGELVVGDSDLVKSVIG